MNLSSQGVEIVGAQDKANTGAIITSVSSGLANIAASIFGPKPVAVTGPAPTPAWLLPVAIGGVGIIALAIFAGKKK